jgi:hypothetical protein
VIYVIQTIPVGRRSLLGADFDALWEIVPAGRQRGAA